MRTRTAPLIFSACLVTALAWAPVSASATPALSPPVTAAATSSSAIAATDAVVSTAEDEPPVQPDSEAEAGRLAFVLIPLIGAVVVVGGAIFVISRGRRRRRGD